MITKYTMSFYIWDRSGSDRRCFGHTDVDLFLDREKFNPSEDVLRKLRKILPNDCDVDKGE